MTPAPLPSSNLSITDRATVLTILTAIAGVITAAWPGHDVAPFIQPVALAIAGLAPALLIFSKHHYAQGIGPLATTVVPLATAATVSPALVTAATQAAQAAVDAAAAVSATLAGLGTPPQ